MFVFIIMHSNRIFWIEINSIARVYLLIDLVQNVIEFMKELLKIKHTVLSNFFP